MAVLFGVMGGFVLGTIFGIFLIALMDAGKGDE